jgi:endonuclease/exonuclease/phosphatase (EEP) superfamily protein YafD
MLLSLLVLLGGIALVGTLLPLLPVRAWWVRAWDFPRVQLLLLALIALTGLLLHRPEDTWARALVAALGVAAAFQAGFVWRYTPLAPREVQSARRAEDGATLSLLVTNVLQTNRRADRVLAVARAADPDVALFVETDGWWRERLDVLAATHPYGLRCPLPNTYGMVLYSRLPLEEPRIEFLVEDDVPSMQARVVLRSGTRVWLNCVHPRPPAPGERDESLERDAELLLVGRRVAGARPVVVCGDLNDVAWSRTTRLFQKVSRLLDPRKGRGRYSTFHARWPFFRWPLDHIFFSDDFRLVRLRTLPYTGSDHFPVHAVLRHEPPASRQQNAPELGREDESEANEAIAEARDKHE